MAGHMAGHFYLQDAKQAVSAALRSASASGTVHSYPNKEVPSFAVSLVLAPFMRDSFALASMMR